MNYPQNIPAIGMFAMVMIAVAGLVVSASAASTIQPDSITSEVEPGEEIVKTMTVDPDSPVVGDGPYTITADASDCGIDAIGNDVVTITPSTQTNVFRTNVIVFTEEISAMPGVYSCQVSFVVTDGSGNQDETVQSIEIEVIGSKGYWKHNDDALEDTLDSGKTLGALNVNDPDVAKNILSQKGKNTIDKLARQLLAAKLNVMTGVDSSCIDSAILAADAQLTNFGYTGPDSVDNNDTKPVKSTLTGLNATLDNFNNEGCP